MASSHTLIVSEVNFDKDWDDLFLTYWESWKQPFQAVGRLTFAGIGEGGQVETDSFNQTKRAYLMAARASPNQIWRKVEDPCRRQRGLPTIVGGGAFTQFTGNPFTTTREKSETSGAELPGAHYKSGSERHCLVQEFYRRMWSWRPRLMQRPHSCKYNPWWNLTSVINKVENGLTVALLLTKCTPMWEQMAKLYGSSPSIANLARQKPFLTHG